MSLTPEQVRRHLEEPVYSWDVSSLLSGIVDYLEFSEQNLGSQRQREVQRARVEAGSLDFGPENAHLLAQARQQIVESAELRFDIGLSQSIRYAGIVAYITSVEWCMKIFATRLAQSLSNKPKGQNEAVHTLEHLNTKIATPRAEQVKELKRLIAIRNCIVHAAGLVEGWQYEPDVRSSIAALDGFSLCNTGFLGDTVHVAAGAVDRLAREALVWLPALDKECSNNGTFGQHP